MVLDDVNKSEINIKLFFKMDFVKVIINFRGPFCLFPYLVHCKMYLKFHLCVRQYHGPHPTGWLRKLYCV